MSCPVIELTQQLIRRPSLSPDYAEFLGMAWAG